MPLSIRILRLCLPLCLLLAMAGPAWAQQADLGVITVKERNLAEKIHAQLAKGAKFEPLAKQYSVGPAASRGGRLGNIPLSRLRGEYRRALSGLAKGVPSKVIPTEEGYTILMLFSQPAPEVARPPAAPAAPAPPSAERAAPAPPPAGPRPPAGGEPFLAARSEVMAGLEFMVVGEFKNASAHFARAMKRNPYEHSAEFMYQITQGALKGTYSPKAVARLGKGFVALTQGDTEIALAELRAARQQEPKLWQARLLEANVLAGMGEYKQAEKAFQVVLMANPRAARAYLSLGQMALEQEDFAGATNYLNKALAIDPSLAEPHYHLGIIAMARGDMEQAAKELETAIKANPYMEDAYNDLGMLYAASERLDQAEASYRKALELNPEMARAHVNLGIVFIRRNQLNQAIEEFTKAVNLEPDLGGAHYNLALAYAIKQNWAQAIKHADLARELRFPVPDDLLKALQPHRRGTDKDGAR